MEITIKSGGNQGLNFCNTLEALTFMTFGDDIEVKKQMLIFS